MANTRTSSRLASTCSSSRVGCGAGPDRPVWRSVDPDQPELLDGLRAAVLEDLELFLPQVDDRGVFPVGDDDINGDVVDAGAECGLRIRWLRRARGWLLLRRAAQGKSDEQDHRARRADAA